MRSLRSPTIPTPRHPKLPGKRSLHLAQKCGLRQTQDAQTPTLRSLIPMPSQRKECHMWDKQGACFEGQRPNVTFASGPTASLGRLDWGPGRLWYPYDVTAVTRLRLMGLVGMFGDWDCGLRRWYNWGDWTAGGTFL